MCLFYKKNPKFNCSNDCNWKNYINKKSENLSPHLCPNNWKYSKLFNYQPWELQEQWVQIEINLHWLKIRQNHKHIINRKLSEILLTHILNYKCAAQQLFKKQLDFESSKSQNFSWKWLGKDEPSVPEDVPLFPSSFLLKIQVFYSKLKGFWEAEPNHRGLFVHKIHFFFPSEGHRIVWPGVQVQQQPLNWGFLVALVPPWHLLSCFFYTCTSQPRAPQGWRQHLP